MQLPSDIVQFSLRSSFTCFHHTHSVLTQACDRNSFSFIIHLHVGAVVFAHRWVCASVVAACVFIVPPARCGGNVLLYSMPQCDLVHTVPALVRIGSKNNQERTTFLSSLLSSSSL